MKPVFVGGSEKPQAEVKGGGWNGFQTNPESEQIVCVADKYVLMWAPTTWLCQH